MWPDRLSTSYAALADPARHAILARPTSGEAWCRSWPGPFEMSLPGVSKHLKVLGCAVVTGRDHKVQWGPCRLEAGPLKNAADWRETTAGSGKRASTAWTII